MRVSFFLLGIGRASLTWGFYNMFQEKRMKGGGDQVTFFPLLFFSNSFSLRYSICQGTLFWETYYLITVIMASFMDAYNVRVDVDLSIFRKMIKECNCILQSCITSLSENQNDNVSWEMEWECYWQLDFGSAISVFEF